MAERDRIREYQQVLRGDTHSIAWGEVEAGMRSGSPKVRYLAFLLAFEGSHRVTGGDDNPRARLCIDYLLDLIAKADSNEEITLHEACEYFRVLFERWWAAKESKPDSRDAICGAIRDALGRCCALGQPSSDTVITVCLEHLFIDDEIREFFRAWLSRKELSRHYREACDLANKWKTP